MLHARSHARYSVFIRTYRESLRHFKENCTCKFYYLHPVCLYRLKYQRYNENNRHVPRLHDKRVERYVILAGSGISDRRSFNEPEGGSSS